MKKIYSFMLIVLSLFSCVFFSACGDNFNNLRINIYSGDGSLLEEVRFVIEDVNDVKSEKLTIQFSNIDEDEVGQILVYSIPNNLISATNYKYNGNKCSVDITPEMSSNNAKLIVSHLASGKKKQIPLTIDQKSTSADVIKDGSYPRNKYIVSIPQIETAEHYVNLSSAFELKPSGSTDKIFFKVDDSHTLKKDNTIDGFDGVKLIPADIKGLDGVFVGFETTAGVVETANENSALKIYPVTFLEDYNIEQQIKDQDQYQNKTISVYFKKVLKQENVVLSPQTAMDLKNIQLIANDEILNSFKLTLKNKYQTESTSVEEVIFDKKTGNSFFDMYELEFFSADETKVSAFADANNDVIVSALTYTEQPIEITVLLSPINFVGDIQPIELTIKVKGELKSEKITVSKNGEEIPAVDNIISDINIFDYYETGTSLGSLFEFNPGENVHSDINKMRIYVKPSILATQNVTGKLPEDVQVGSMLYSLMFNLVDDYLKFTYNGSLGMMVSAEIDSSTKVYVKYISGTGKTEPVEFGASVQTTNRSSIKHWDKLESEEVYLDFTPLKGVKTMELQAGYYYVEDDMGYHKIYPSNNNIENIYLNRLEGLDNLDEDVYTNFIYVADTVKGFDDQLIDGDQPVEFEVFVESLNGATNPLKLYKKETTKDDGEDNIEGVSSLTYKYSKNTTNDVIGLVYRSNTSLGDYKITFKQEQVVKATLICRVYENLTEIKTEYVSIETNKQAFKNSEFPEYESDYIVASGKKLDLSINLPKAVLDSGLVEGYVLTFKVGAYDGEEFVEAEIETAEYFDILGDANLMELDFIKGTFLDGKPQYVYLTIQVVTKVHETIVSEAILADPAPSVEFSFFIYEEIKEEDLSINRTSVERYPEKYLAIDYKHLSKLNLEIDMDDELWNYTTGSVDVVWSIDGNILEFNYDSDGDGENDCYVESGVIVETDFGLNNCEFKFNTITGVDDYVKVIKAHIKQFNTIFEFQCVVYVEKPIITERLVVESETYTTPQSSNPYINLKVGEKYQVLARNLSSLGDVTNPEIVVQVVDEYGSAYNAKKYFEVNQTTSEITVKTIDKVNKFKLVVFAKDAIKESISQDKSGYNVPSNFLMEDYADAYYVIDIYLSDGSESNPYLIKNSYDFWEINEHELFKQAHYQLMTNISLDDVDDTQIIKTIDGFTGFISTYGNEIYTIDGIYLDKDMKNLFTNFGGEISNIKFSVNYAYNIDESVDQYLGLIDRYNGDQTLTNVGVYVRGYADLNGEATYYFGGLVGENNATIQYKDGHEDFNSDGIVDEDEIVWVGIVGVDGLINLTGNATVYFGGVAGKNTSKIIGCESTITTGGENEIILNVAGGRENSLSQISICAEIDGESAIGGVVGLNTYNTNVGTVHNAYVQATIVAENTSNVGGVIGKNIQNKKSFAVSSTNNGVVVDSNTLSQVDNDYKAVSIYNVRSASTIKALNNVGGIVGFDINGIYLDCDYQVLTATYKETAIVANNAVGGIAGSSNSGIFIFCSVMSYNWNYGALSGASKDYSKVITDVADIYATDYVGGIVGSAESSINDMLNPFNGGDVNNKVIVVSSSVNAYLKSTVNIGGILSSNVGNAILYNVYFIGKLEGSLVYSEASLASKQYFALDNDGSSYFNAVYSLNLETSGGVTTLKTGSILDNSDFDIDSATTANYWWWNANINGGYIFITKDESGTESSAPIFDLAPDEIDVTVNKEQPEGLERVLMLDYYDFSIAENATDAILLELVELKNRSNYIYKLDRDGKNVGLLNIVAKPSTLGAVVINVKSTNSNIVDVTYDGRILINGVGECELIFSSVLNPNAGNVSNRTIKVFVDYPKTDLHLSTSRTDKSKYVENNSQNIGKGSSKQYYAVTNGEFEYHESVYQYKTKTDFNFYVEVGYETADDEFKIVDYLAITGTKATSANNQYIVDIDDKTPFMISVLKMLESGVFNVKVSPYVIVNEVKVYLDTVEFTLSTLKGLTNVSFGYDEAVVYPNDIVYLNTYLTTDHKLTQDTISNLILIDSYEEYYNYLLNEDNVNNIEYYIYKNETKIEVS